MPTIVLKSHAKLNLYLRVSARRPDGYHDIETVFERISLCDTVGLSTVKGPAIRLRCNQPGVPLDESNLCVRAALALREACGITAGCDIRLTKRIPMGAGMGGGSSNGAAVLTGLCRLWRVKLSPVKLMRIAAGLGSDVPFFMTGARFALARGRGEKLRPLHGPALHHVILMPPVHSSTREIYAGWDTARALTSPAADATILLSALTKREPAAICAGLRNDLERVAGKKYPAIIRARETLAGAPGCAGCLMTGSGAAVFGIFTSITAADTCARRLRDGRVRVFRAETA